MRRIHFITCSFIEDNNTRQPNDDIVVAVALNSSSAHYFVGSVSLSALSLFGTFHSFSIRYVCVCVVAPHSFSLSCFFVNAVSQLCVNISIQKKKNCVSFGTACAHSFSSDELLPISRAVGCSVCRLFHKM